ncbi:hypothetical protein KP509_13G002600 [Ceratopteris richardii]|uniref:U-box domain-containing protein n=1 Tax=Ceratopteris richardii TaxID=49495 RepID=A0A8T2TCL3_CERRI|nr:hypothetical protein KP509_13G002600 [Ceratopteris richardii]KAH7420341.1 hypothetical protein KP509_13G002600 [Ceratopteris richardii]
MGEEKKGVSRSPRWVRFADRTRVVAPAAKERKGEARDDRGTAARGENACARKKSFWQSPCIRIIAASDTSITIRPGPHSKGKVLPETGAAQRSYLEGRISQKLQFNGQLDASESSFDGRCHVEGNYIKHPIECSNDAGERVHDYDMRPADYVAPDKCTEGISLISESSGRSRWDDSFSEGRDAKVPHEWKAGCISPRRHLRDSGHEVLTYAVGNAAIPIEARLDEGNTDFLIAKEPSSRSSSDSVRRALNASEGQSRSSELVPDDSFVSCLSCSFSSCSNHPDFVSCSSLSISRLLQDVEPHSLTSSLSSRLPEEYVNSKSHISSHAARYSFGISDRLREGTHSSSSPSTASSARSSSCWDQELCCSPDVKKNGSSPSERAEGCSRYSMVNYANTFSGRHSAYMLSRVQGLVHDLQSDHTDMQLSAAAELRLLAKHDDQNRRLIARVGACKPLIDLLYSSDESIQLEATTALLNLSLNEALKEYVVKEGAIEAVVEVLSYGLNVVVKENAAVALAHLAVCETNQSKIGAAGAIPPLIELLGGGSPRGKKDAAAALYRISCIDDNKRKMIRAGALRPLIGFISNKEDKEGMLDKAMAILGNLVSIEQGRVAFVDGGGIKPLLQVIQVGPQRSKSLAISVIFQLCSQCTKYRSLMPEKELLTILMSLAKTANPRLKYQISEVMKALIADS